MLNENNNIFEETLRNRQDVALANFLKKISKYISFSCLDIIVEN